MRDLSVKDITHMRGCFFLQDVGASGKGCRVAFSLYINPVSLVKQGLSRSACRLKTKPRLYVKASRGTQKELRQRAERNLPKVPRLPEQVYEPSRSSHLWISLPPRSAVSNGDAIGHKWINPALVPLRSDGYLYAILIPRDRVLTSSLSVFW